MRQKNEEVFILYYELISAICAQRVLNNFIIGELKAKLIVVLCFEDPAEQSDKSKKIDSFNHDDKNVDHFLLKIERKDEIDYYSLQFKYSSVFHLDI